MTRVLLFGIAFYRATFSKIFGGNCRFYPSCSEYGETTLRRYGWRGVPRILGRILRCHPWNPGGFDPVPETETRRGPVG